jgi:probable HAF family extracellular repeat protein
MKNAHGLGLPRRRGLLAAAGVAALGLAATAPAHSDPPAPAYIIYDTGTLGGTFAFGAGVDNLGWVTGASLNAAGALHATLAIPGNLIDLGTLGGTNSAVEWPVKNNHGLVVGISESATPDKNGEVFSCVDFIPTNGHTCLPFLWQNGALSQLALLGGNNGFATGVNNAGIAVGWAETAVHDGDCVLPQVLQFLAVEWGPGTAVKRVLPPYGRDTTSAATAINDAGEVVGISGACDNAVGAYSARHALLWINGQPIKLPTLGGAGWNTPMAINNAGIIVGFLDTPGDVSGGVLTPNSQAVIWTPDGIINLHTLPGDATAQATGINDFNQVVGTSFEASGAPHAVFLWQNGQLYDLNSLLQTDAPLQALETGDINDRGEITGLACVLVDGACGPVAHTFVAIPAPGSRPPGWQPAQVSQRPQMSAELRQQLAQHSRLMHAQAQRPAAP